MRYLKAVGITARSARKVAMALKYLLLDPATAGKIAVLLHSGVGYRRNDVVARSAY